MTQAGPILKAKSSPLASTATGRDLRELMVARSLCLTAPAGRTETRAPLSADAKNRLYNRMFPDVA